MPTVAVIFIFLFSSLVMAGTDVIYGIDNRWEVYERPQWQEHAKAVAAMFYNDNLFDETAKTFQVDSTTLAEKRQLCNGQRFADQPAPVTCSGFLIAPDLIMTAGHCVKDQATCKRVSWVFDYKMSPGKAPLEIKKENLYGCSEVVLHSHGEEKADYAVLRLNRPTLRSPLKLKKTLPPVGEPLAMLGFPSGLPMKVTEDGEILSHQSLVFTTNLDAFTVNSGSAVLSENTGEVLGVLVRGQTDYVGQGQCQVVNVLPESKGGEFVTPVTLIPRNF